MYDSLTESEVIGYMTEDTVPCYCTKCKEYIMDAEPDLRGTNFSCEFCKSSGKHIKSILVIFGFMLLMAAGCSSKPPVGICEAPDTLKTQFKDMQVGLKLAVKKDAQWHCQRGAEWKERENGNEASRWVCMNPKDMKRPLFFDVLIAEEGNLVLGIKRVDP